MWVNNSKSSYTYDVNNNEIEELQKNWIDSVWVNEYKLTRSYDVNNNQKELLIKEWDGSAWINESKILYNYDVNNNPTESLYQTWDGSNWMDVFNFLLTYDANNNLVELLMKDWNGSAWLNNRKLLYTYDGNNNLTALLSQNWESSAWVNYEKYSYTYVPVTAVNENLSFVNSYNLSNNYPNPFNPSTKLIYTIPERSNVSLKVFDLLGNEVAELVNNEIAAGTYHITFNATDLSSGVYFYQLRAGDFVQTKKMILLR